MAPPLALSPEGAAALWALPVGALSAPLVGAEGV